MPTLRRLLALCVATALVAEARIATADDGALPPPGQQVAAPPAALDPPAPEVKPVVAPAPVVAVPVVAAPVVVTPDAKADAKTEDVPRPKWKLCIGLGAGAAVALITGAVLGGLAKQRSNEQEGNVGSPPLYTAELAHRGHEGERFASTGYVFLALGGALAIADIALWVERLRPHKQTAEAKHAALPISAGLGGLEVSFR